MTGSEFFFCFKRETLFKTQRKRLEIEQKDQRDTPHAKKGTSKRAPDKSIREQGADCNARYRQFKCADKNKNKSTELVPWD